MRASEVMDVNAKTRESAKKKMNLHHVEIHPERDKHGKPVKGGGHTVHSVHSEDGNDWASKRAEKPFGAGEHEEMLAHVANELKLPEPEGERGGEGEEDEGEGHTPAID